MSFTLRDQIECLKRAEARCLQSERDLLDAMDEVRDVSGSNAVAVMQSIEAAYEEVTTTLAYVSKGISELTIRMQGGDA